VLGIVTQRQVAQRGKTAEVGQVRVGEEVVDEGELGEVGEGGGEGGEGAAEGGTALEDKGAEGAVVGRKRDKGWGGREGERVLRVQDPDICPCPITNSHPVVKSNNIAV
jgi:hypothetical protein